MKAIWIGYRASRKRGALAAAGLAAVAAPVFIGMLNAHATKAQSGAVRPTFEVVATKREAPIPPVQRPVVVLACRGIDGIRRHQVAQKDVDVPLGRCLTDNTPLANVIQLAYDTPDTIASGADLRAVLNAPYHIEGKASDPSTATRQQLLEMLEVTLEERFSLRFHRETAEVSGFAIVVAKTGLKLKPTEGDDNYDLKPDINNMDERGNNGSDIFRGKSSVKVLAQILSVRNMLSTTPRTMVPVVDKTGLAGIYEIRMVTPRAPGSSGQVEGETPYPERRFDAVLEQLSRMGLQLRAEKLPLETIVVDRVKAP